jgi:hypothetical protein
MFERIFNSYAVTVALFIVGGLTIPFFYGGWDGTIRILSLTSYGLWAFAFGLSYFGHFKHEILPEVVNLPDAPKVPKEINLQNQTSMISFFLAYADLGWLGGGHSALFGELGSAIFLVGLAGLAFGYQVFVILYDFYRVSKVEVLNKKAAQLLKAYNPAFGIFLNYGEHSTALTTWLPYFRKFNKPFIVLTSSFIDFRNMERNLDIPAVLINRNTVNRLVPKSVKAMFYPIMRAANDTPLRMLNSCVHLFIGHGESDKTASAHRLYRSYDKFCVPGQAGVDRFEQNGIATRSDFFELIGRPQLENMLTQAQSSKNDPTFTVLYAPTWFGSQADDHHSSIGRGLEIVKALTTQGIRVIFKPHPLSTVKDPLGIINDDRALVRKIDQFIKSQVQSSGLKHLDSSQTNGKSLTDFINQSDALIGDVSSVVIDYLITDKPLAINSNYSSLEKLYTDKPMTRSLYAIDKSLNNLDQIIQNLRSDPTKTDRSKLKVYYLGPAEPQDQVDYFLDKIGKYIN